MTNLVSKFCGLIQCHGQQVLASTTGLYGNLQIILAFGNVNKFQDPPARETSLLGLGEKLGRWVEVETETSGPDYWQS